MALDVHFTSLRPSQAKVFAAGDLIIKEGDDGNEFFIVEEGEVVCTKTKEGVETEVSELLGTGSYFGELALLNGVFRGVLPSCSWTHALPNSLTHSDLVVAVSLHGPAPRALARNAAPR